MAVKGRPRSVSPPPEFSDDAKALWRAAVRQLQTQGTWRAVDGPLLESYVQSVLSARTWRRTGRDDLAAVAERDAFDRADKLLLTPESRRHASNGKPSPPRNGHGIIESSTSIAEVA